MTHRCGQRRVVDVLHLSSTELIVFGLLGLLWAGVGYALSEQAKRTTGRTPWGLPSLVWALFWFLSVLVGLVLFLIAQFTENRRTGRLGSSRPTSSTGTASTATPGRANPGSQFPAYPRPANSPVPGDLPAPSTGRPRHEPPVPAAPQHDPGYHPSMCPPSWQPDPSGRFHFRWWNGAEWTTQVSTHGQHLIDTSPDQRIGPY
jgi:Protein of unknown function (DUF2510)